MSVIALQPIKVLKPQMLIGHLLEMSVGSESTPKGGHAADLAARAATEVASACGPREKMRCARARGSWNPRPARAARGSNAAALVPVGWVRRATCSRHRKPDPTSNRQIQRGALHSNLDRSLGW